MSGAFNLNNGGPGSPPLGIADKGATLEVMVPSGYSISALQWFYVNGDGSTTDISGATASPYTKQSADRGKKIGVRATAFVLTSPNPVLVPLQSPGAPTIGTATGGDKQASFAFTPPSDNGGSAITKYTAYVYDKADDSLVGTVDVAGSPAVKTGLTNGRQYYGRVSATNALGEGAKSAASAIVTAQVVRTGILRAVSSFNRMPTKSQAASSTYAGRTAMFYQHVIGSGDVDGLVARITNRYGSTSAVLNGASALNNFKMYLEHQGLNLTRQMFFGGAATINIAAGQLEQLTDVLLPSAFGLSKFTVGDKVRLRFEFDIAQNGAWPVNNYYDVSYTSGNVGSRGWIYDPTVTTINNLAGTGPLNSSGTAPTGTAAMPVMLLGTFVSGDPLTFLTGKDSLGEGYYDTAGALAGLGTGQFVRALYGDGSAPMAGINASVFGCTNLLWVNGWASMGPLVKYCNIVDYGLGTNSFDASANNSTTLDQVLTNDRAVWANMRSSQATGTGVRALKIYGEMLVSRSAAGGDYTTLAGQTVFGPKWAAGGDVAARNAAYLGYVSQYLDGTFDPGAVVRGSTDPANADYYKWAPNYSNDGTHYSATGVVPWANAKRAFYLSLAA